MKRLAWISGILIFAAMLLAAVGCVCSAVDQIATDENFYSGMSRVAVAKELGVTDDPQVSTKVTEYIGLTDGEQDAFAAQMAAFMAGGTDGLPEILNEKEQQHMRDVRAITQAAADRGQTFLTIAAVAAILAAWTGAKLKKRVKPKIAGVLSAVSVIMLAVTNVVNQVSGGGFSVAFVQMHEAMFANDLWLMNPAQDILIRMMPQLLFEQALLEGASVALRMFVIAFVMMAAAHVIVENMLRRHVAKAEK